MNFKEYNVPIYFWHRLHFLPSPKKSIFLRADCIVFHFLQANQIVECQSIKSVGVAEFSIFCLFPRDRRDLVIFDHTTWASLKSCAALAEMPVKDKSIVFSKKTHFDTRAKTFKDRNHPPKKCSAKPKLQPNLKWVFKIGKKVKSIITHCLEKLTEVSFSRGKRAKVYDFDFD